MLKQMLGAYRYAYNYAISFIQNLTPTPKYYVKYNDKEKHFEKKRKNKSSMITMRAQIKKNFKKWMYDVPSHLLDNAIAEASKNYSAAISTSIKTGKFHELKFKSKKRLTVETMTIEKSAIKEKKPNSIYPSFLGTFKCNDTLTNKKDFTISYHKKLKEWNVNIPYDNEPVTNNHKHDFVSLDPGEVNFLTGYAVDHGFMMGENTRERFMKVAKEVDKIKSLHDTSKEHDKRKSLRKAMHAKLDKIKNLRDDLHWKSAKYLAKNYKNIVIPIFQTSDMVKNLNHTVSRNIMTQSHYKFRMRLLHKAQEYGSKVYVVTEEYTSKTCTKCGRMDTLSETSYRTKKCSGCKIELNRDLNGARNIFLKHIC